MDGRNKSGHDVIMNKSGHGVIMSKSGHDVIIEIVALILAVIAALVAEIHVFSCRRCRHTNDRRARTFRTTDAEKCWDERSLPPQRPGWR